MSKLHDIVVKIVDDSAMVWTPEMEQKAKQDLKDLVRDELAKQVQTGAIDMVSINIEQFVEAL